MGKVSEIVLPIWIIFGVFFGPGFVFFGLAYVVSGNFEMMLRFLKLSSIAAVFCLLPTLSLMFLNKKEK